ncbi:MAG: carbohydrate binding domain-containing protein [Planctomycetota bacterium]
MLTKRLFVLLVLTVSLQACAGSKPQIITHRVKPITDRQIHPSTNPEEFAGSDTVRARACRGEYEAASFIVHPPKDDITLEVSCTDLKSKSGMIAAGNIDIRVVKCWYQSGKPQSRNDEGKNILCAELLLKDDSLVRVDTDRQENHVKLQFPDGSVKWWNISDRKAIPPAPEIDNTQDFLCERLPIKDSKTLRPVTVAAGETRQFWITVHVPDDATSGLYKGRLKLHCNERLAKEIPFEVEVLPFDLEPCPIESSLYFNWGLTLDKAGSGSLDNRMRTPAQHKAELENALAHGVNAPTLGVDFESGDLPLALGLRNEAGMKTDTLYYITFFPKPEGEQGDDRRSLIADKMKEGWDEDLSKIINTAKKFGYNNVYFYGRDEARGDLLRAQRPLWDQVHTLGGKIFCAGYKGSNFPIVGDVQDLLICAGPPSKKEADLWHSKGNKIFRYNSPQSCCEIPATMRLEYGLSLGLAGYDGAMPYIYYWWWNDWADRGGFRPHNFVYPTIDGVIDTRHWEGYREGIDDLRYWATMKKAIAKAKKEGVDVSAAEEFTNRMPLSIDLDTLRNIMIKCTVNPAVTSKEIGEILAAGMSDIATSLIVNSNFADGHAGGWDTWGKVKVVSSNAYAGQYAGEISGRGGFNKILQVKPATRYKARLWIKNPSGEKLNFGVKDYGGQEIVIPVAGHSEYKQYEVCFTVGNYNTAATVCCWKMDGSMPAYCDDIKIETDSQ